MSPEIWAAFIGGGAGIITACATSYLTTRGAAAALDRDDRRRSQYLAANVAPSLRQFASACLSVGYDDGSEEGRPAGENGEHQATVDVEPFKLDGISALDWQSLPPGLMVDVLTFEEKRQAIEVSLSDWHHYYDPPDHPVYFSDRQLAYVDLGIAAVQLGNRLFRETGLTSSLPGAEDVERDLRARKVEIEQSRQARADRIAAFDQPALGSGLEPAAI